MSDYTKSPVTDLDLAEFDDEYVQNEVNEESYDAVPDGKYQAQVESVELTRTMKGDPMLKWTLKIVGPTQAGRKLWRSNSMATLDNRNWLKKDLYACGLRLARLSELPANLDRLLDIRMEVTLKSRTGDDGKLYQSVYFNKRLKTAEEVLAEPASAHDALSRF